MKRLFIITLTAAIILGILTLPATAENKLERGPKNIILGWTEVPHAVVRVTKETNNPFLGITIGLIEGVLNAIARTASGTVDTVTFGVNPDAEPAVKPGMIKEAGAGTK